MNISSIHLSLNSSMEATLILKSFARYRIHSFWSPSLWRWTEIVLKTRNVISIFCLSLCSLIFFYLTHFSQHVISSCTNWHWLAMRLGVWGSTPDLWTYPDGPGGPSSFLYHEYWPSFQKQNGRSMALITHSFLAPGSNVGRALPLPPLRAPTWHVTGEPFLLFDYPV
jgi:hypothetical protein